MATKVDVEDHEKVDDTRHNALESHKARRAGCRTNVARYARARRVLDGLDAARPAAPALVVDKLVKVLRKSVSSEVENAHG